MSDVYERASHCRDFHIPKVGWTEVGFSLKTIPSNPLVPGVRFFSLKWPREAEGHLIVGVPIATTTVTVT